MLTFYVIVPILIAVFLYLFPFKKAARIVSIITQIGLTVATVFLFINSRENEIVTAIGNYGVLGITLRADALAAAFILLTAFIFLAAAVYSFSSNTSSLFWFLLFIWEASIIGIFLSGDMFNIFVLMEVGTVAVSVLIMYNRKNRSMYDGMIYLMINVVVVQFYLFGLGYVYRTVGTFDIEAAGYAFATIEATQQILPFALIMTFVALKCALVPVFSWLPKAHGTPGASAAVSAVLSGLYIKCGIYLFIRFQGVFAGVDATNLFIFVGVLTAIVGVIMSLAQTDIKLILAYSTVAQIGLIFIGLNIGNFFGSMYHVVAHAVFKVILFMGAGVIIHTYNTRDTHEISGVWRRLPLVSIAMILAILGMIGTPLFGGSVSKYFLAYNAGGVINAIMIAINLGTIMIFVKFAYMFFGKTQGEKVKADWWQQVPLLALGAACIALGILSEVIVRFMFNEDITIDLVGYLQKTGIFAVSLVAGFAALRYYVKDSALLARIKTLEFGFRGMCAAIGVFFAAVVVYLRFL